MGIRGQSRLITSSALLLLLALRVFAAQPVSFSEIRQDYFIENRGQVLVCDSSMGTVRFYARMHGYQIYICDEGISYVLSEAQSGQLVQADRPGLRCLPAPFQLRRMDLRLVGRQLSSQVEGQSILSQRISFRRPHLNVESVEVSCFDELYYRNVYNGIDLRFRLQNGALKYDFIVHPGADASRIALKLEHANGLELTEEGRLRMTVGQHVLQDEAPIAWQNDSQGVKRDVAVHYHIDYAQQIRFRYDSYDKGREFVIDPAITWATFFGGTKDDQIQDVALDKSGNLIICGSSQSDIFPGTGTVKNGDYDLFLSSFTPNGQLIASTYLGSTDLEIAYGLAIDNSGNIFVCGESKSLDLGFAVNVFQAFNAKSGEKDALIIKFNSALKYIIGTFIGGTSIDEAFDIAVDASGNIGVVGKTSSSDFPVKQAHYSRHSGNFDAFVSKWSNTLSYLWGTFYGGADLDAAVAVEFDALGRLYVGGDSQSTDLPDLNGFQRVNKGASDGLLSLWTSSGDPVVLSLLGGTGFDNVLGLTLFGNRVLACGITGSGNSFPSFANPHAYDRSGNTSDGYVAMFDENIVGKWSTLWGGDNAEYFYNVAVNTDSSIVCVGTTNSSDYPTKRPIQANHTDGVTDLVVNKFDFQGSAVWATALGGSKAEGASYTALCLDKIGNMYIGGSTSSPDFPVRNPQFPSLSDAIADGVLVKMCPTTPIVHSSIADTVICAGRSVRLSVDTGLTAIQWSTGATTDFIDVSTAGTYSYSAVSKYGCRALSDTMKLSVQSKVAVGVQQRGKTQLCPGDSVLLYSREQFDGYSWRDQNGKEVGTTDSLYVKTPGSYYLQVVDLSGCHDKSAVFTIGVNSKPKLHYSALIDAGTLIDSVGANLVLCQGQPLDLRIAVGTTYFVYWSNAKVGQTIQPTTSEKLVAFITDSSGCQWVMDTVNVIFTKRSPLTLNTADTVCALEQSKVDIQGALSGQRFLWRVQGGTIVGTQDSSSIKISWNGVGQYTVSAYPSGVGGCADTGRYTIVVRNSLAGGISLPDGPYICKSSSVRLYGPKGYANYTWNGVSGGADSLIAKSAGRYTLRFDNGLGCEGFDTVDLEDPINVSLDNNAIFFDTTRVTQSSSRRFLIRNDGLAPLSLGTLNFGVSSFVVDSIVPGGQSTIGVGDSAWVYLSFHPLSSGDSYDTLWVHLKLPCTDSLKIIAHGIGKSLPPAPILRFRLTDLDLDPMQSPITIPILAWMDVQETPPLIDSLIFRIDYPSSMIRINSVSNGSVRNSWDPARQRMQAYLRVFVDSLASVPTSICALNATVFLGDRMKDSMYVDSCAPHPGMNSSLKLEGSELRYLNVCQTGGTRLLGSGPGQQMMVYPNPSDEQLHLDVLSSENAVFELVVVDVQGAEILRRGIAMSVGAQQHLQLPVQDFESGVYVILFQGPTGTTAVPIQVVH